MANPCRSVRGGSYFESVASIRVNKRPPLELVALTALLAHDEPTDDRSELATHDTPS